jgi:hypothetical protein
MVVESGPSTMIAMEAKEREQHSSSHYHSRPKIAIILSKVTSPVVDNGIKHHTLVRYKSRYF